MHAMAMVRQLSQRSGCRGLSGQENDSSWGFCMQITANARARAPVLSEPWQRQSEDLYSSIFKHLGQHQYVPSDPRPTARDNRASRHTDKRRSDCAGRRCRTARYPTVRQTFAIYCDCWRGRRESPSCRRQHCCCAVAVATNGLELKSLGCVEFCWIRPNRDRDQVTAIATPETGHHKDEKCCQRSTRKVFHGAPPEFSAQRSKKMSPSAILPDVMLPVHTKVASDHCGVNSPKS
jgi:hypothetical protein